MAYSFVSQIGTLGNNGNSATVPIPVGVGGAALGNLVVVTVSAKGTTSTISGCADNKGNVYTVDVQGRGGNSTNVETGICSSVLTTPLVNGDTITVTYSGTTTSQAGCALEFTGTNALPVDQTGQQSSGLTANPTTPTVQTLQNEELVVCAFGLELGGGDTLTATPGFTPQSLTAVGAAGVEGLYTEYQIVAFTGAYHGAPHDSTSTRGIESCIATYKAVPSVAVDPSAKPFLYMRQNT